MEETLEEVMENISDVLSNKEYHGLGVEIIATAFQELKRDPKLSIQQALYNGYLDWIK